MSHCYSVTGKNSAENASNLNEACETKDLCQAHLALTKPFLHTAQCRVLPLADGRLLRVLGQTLQYPLSLLRRWPLGTGAGSSGTATWHRVLLSWSAGVAVTTLRSVLCRLSVWPQTFLQSVHFSVDINISAEKNPVSEESFKKWTEHWKEELGCCLDPAITLVNKKTSFSLFPHLCPAISTKTARCTKTGSSRYEVFGRSGGQHVEDGACKLPSYFILLNKSHLFSLRLNGLSGKRS